MRAAHAKTRVVTPIGGKRQDAMMPPKGCLSIFRLLGTQMIDLVTISRPAFLSKPALCPVSGSGFAETARTTHVITIAGLPFIPILIDIFTATALAACRPLAWRIDIQFLHTNALALVAKSAVAFIVAMT